MSRSTPAPTPVDLRTSSLSTHPSPITPRKPAVKRRKFNHTLDSEFQPGRALTDNSNIAPTPNGSLYSKLSCSTCHRALSVATRPSVASSSTCSRCAAPTCAICARTCTSYTRPSSFPPTPALTRSPSPVTPAPVSPKRIALGLSYAAMNCDASSLPAVKRKKRPVDKEDGDGEPNGSAVRDYHDAHGYGAARDGSESTVVLGCGRVVCRACCIESVLNDGKLCTDCFALV